jgi:hypothetical protein
VKKWYQY